MNTKAQQNIIKTFENAMNGTLKISDANKAKSVKYIDGIRDEKYNDPSKILSLYRQLNGQPQIIQNIFINYLLKSISEGSSYAKELYKNLYKIKKELEQYSSKTLLGCTFNQQVSFCLKSGYDDAIRTMLHLVTPDEMPNILMLAVELGDYALLKRSLSVANATAKTEVLHFLPHMKLEEEEIITIAQELVDNEIGTFYMHRAISSAMEQKKRELTQFFILKGKEAIRKWDWFCFREAIWMGEYPLAQLMPTSSDMTKEEAKELKNEYLEGQIRASGSEGDDTSHRKIAVQMLSSMYFSTLTPPDILIPKEELKKTFPFA